MADVAAILGVGPNLGQALVRRFAEGGCDVAMLARDGARLADLGREVSDETGRVVRGVSADATDFGSLRDALARVADEMGPPTVFIHSVSRWIEGRAPELDPDVLMSELALSAGAALVGSQAVLPGMEAAGRGTILWTGSRMALEPAGSAVATATTTGKAALRGLALASAKSFHDRGINFCTVTVNGTIEQGSPLAPAKVAEAFWAAHVAPRDDWVAERMFEGA